MNTTLAPTPLTPAPQLPANHARALGGQPLYLEVAEHLRERIFNRELEPGAWIDEVRLSTELGISRTPLREALKVLAVEGLVTMKIRRGAYVTEMSTDDVRQIYHLMALLESDAAADVARAASEEDLARLRTLHDRLEREAAQREFFFATNEAFHVELQTVAGNRWRLQIVNDLRKVMKLNRHHSLFREGRIQESLNEHRALMQALESRNADAAREIMQAHFFNGLTAAAA